MSGIDGGTMSVSAAVDPEVVRKVADNYAYTPFSELEKERNTVQGQLRKVFDEAGDDLDLAKVKEIPGTAQDKATKIVELNSQLTAFEELIGSKKELKALSDSIRNDNRGGGESTEMIDASMSIAESVAREVARLNGNISFGQQSTYADRVFNIMEEKGLSFKNVESTPLIIDDNFSDGLELFNTLFKRTAGWGPESIRDRGYVPSAQREIQVYEIFPKFRTTQMAIKYMEETTYANAAAETAEAAAYKESTLVLTEKTESIRKITNSLPVTEEQLDDEGQVRMYLDNRVPLMVQQRLDGQLLNGNGQGVNLSGLMKRAGIGKTTLTIPAGNGNKGNDWAIIEKPLHKLLNAKTAVYLTGRASPDHYILHHTFWENIALQETASAGFYLGSPADQFALRIWGLPVVQSDHLSVAAEGSVGVVGDFSSYSAMGIRKDLQTQVGLSGDDFLKDILHIKASVRVGLCVYRPSAFVEIVMAADN